jgi:hypothetical protein
MGAWTGKMAMRQVALSLLAAASTLPGLSCGGEGLAPPTTGDLEITTTTSGAEPDADGYAFTIDGGASQSIGLNATATVANVEASSHTVTLSGVAENCSVEGTNPRSVTVSAAATANVSFVIACTAATGSLEISTATTGASPDPDGYTLSVDTQSPRPIAINETLSIPGLAPGDHSVSISGLASNCQVTNDNPKSATVSPGATASVAFTISCPTPAVARWRPMTSGTTRLLSDVSGGSATSVFVAGEDEILHYDGSTWSTQLLENSLSLSGIWATSATEAFAISLDPDDSYHHGSFLHYDGQAWSGMAAPDPDVCFFCQVYLGAIWGSSGQDVFAVGTWFEDPHDEGAYIAHYNGNAWVRMPVQNDLFVFAHDVWGSSGEDVYLVGSYSPPRDDDADPVIEAGIILHYDGQEWSEVLHEPGLIFISVWGSSAHDIYATAYTLADPGVGTMWHFDGSHWSAIPSPTTEPLRAISGSSASDIFALAGGGDTIWHYNGTNWTQSLTSSVNSLYDIWVSSPTSVFAVGENGTILHGTP